MSINISGLTSGGSEGFSRTTQQIRDAFASAMGFTQRTTMDVTGFGTVYLFWKDASVESCSWDQAYEICTNYWKFINVWSVEQGYGNICIASRMPSSSDTGTWLPGNTWVGTTTMGNYSGQHNYWGESSYIYKNDSSSLLTVPVALII